MFYIKLAEILLKIREKELNDIKTNQPNNQTRIDNLQNEINYLKALFIRYEIASILGLDKDEKYINSDFMGIEEEDINNFNLTPEQVTNFNDLVAKLPNGQLQRYKKRKQLAEILSSSNGKSVEELEGIEMANPSLDYYKLEQDKIDEFNNIANDINTMGPNTTKTVIVNNKTKLTTSELHELIKLLEGNTLDDEEYKIYIKLAEDNINRLYQDDVNKTEVESIINSINPSNYILRHDLSPKLVEINNINLEIKDNELGTIFNYLDQNYDGLDVSIRDKYYNIVLEMINKNKNNLSKINDINQLLLNVTNDNLKERLRKDLSKEELIEFSNQHVSTYEEVLNNSIAKLKSKKNDYENKKPKLGLLATHYDVKIKAFEKEIERLESLKVDYKNNPLLEKLDSKYNKKNDSIIKLKKEIEELKKYKEQIKSKFHKNIIDKRISVRNKKISKLQKSRVKIVNVQKKIMAPKLFIEQKKYLINRHFEAKEEVYKDYSDDYKQLAASERAINGMFNELKASFYEFQANRYQNKAKFNHNICNKLNNAKVTVKGAAKRMINKNRLTQAMQNQQTQQQTFVQTT